MRPLQPQLFFILAISLGPALLQPLSSKQQTTSPTRSRCQSDLILCAIKLFQNNDTSEKQSSLRATERIANNMAKIDSTPAKTPLSRFATKLKNILLRSKYLDAKKDLDRRVRSKQRQLGIEESSAYRREGMGRIEKRWTNDKKRSSPARRRQDDISLQELRSSDPMESLYDYDEMYDQFLKDYSENEDVLVTVSQMIQRYLNNFTANQTDLDLGSTSLMDPRRTHGFGIGSG